MLGVVGFVAQLINSGLGMGYGVTSTTFLLLLGTSPAVASATVNFSQLGSQLVSGVAHWRLGNVDWKVVRRIGVPGAAGGFVGAAFLSRLSLEVARPMVAGILLVLGCYLLIRFTFWGTARGRLGRPLRHRFLVPLGLVGGFLNSAGGAGWGPVGTTALLATGRIEPRKVIGSISAAEFVVVVAGSLGFVLGLGLGGVNLAWVAVMLVTGSVAAPFAAWLARRVPARMLGSLVGGLIVTVNVRSLVGADVVRLPVAGQVAVYAVVVLLWAAAVAWSARAHRAAVAETAPAAA